MTWGFCINRSNQSRGRIIGPRIYFFNTNRHLSSPSTNSRDGGGRRSPAFGPRLLPVLWKLSISPSTSRLLNLNRTPSVIFGSSGLSSCKHHQQYQRIFRHVCSAPDAFWSVQHHRQPGWTTAQYTYAEIKRRKTGDPELNCLNRKSQQDRSLSLGQVKTSISASIHLLPVGIVDYTYNNHQLPTFFQHPLTPAICHPAIDTFRRNSLPARLRLVIQMPIDRLIHPV